jgi:lactoylglutathione lyase
VLGGAVMKYCWTTLHVKNIDQSVKFYQEIVGLPVTRSFDNPQGDKFVFLGDSGTQLELIQNVNRIFQVGDAITLGFSVGSLDETMQYIRDNGIEIDSGPFQPNDHIRFFYVKDPDGIRIQFSQSF